MSRRPWSERPHNETDRTSEVISLLVYALLVAGALAALVVMSATGPDGWLWYPPEWLIGPVGR